MTSRVRRGVFGPGSPATLSRRRAPALVLAALLAVVAVPGAAHADIVRNNVVAGGSPTVAAGETTSIGYSIQNLNTNQGGDPENQCNARAASPATLTINAPAAVSVTPVSRVFTSCDTTQTFGFSSSTPGSYSISVSVSDSGIGTYLTSGATFTLVVTPPVVTNTAPTVTISNVTDGASYEFGNVPVARCDVSDQEDGDTSFDAALSALVGPRAAEGLGSQTASCNHDDTGGKNAHATLTYDIVDTSGPLVTVDAPDPTEATGASTPVAFAASAYDEVDGNRPVTCTTSGGAVLASGDGFPVGTTTLTCSATDKAGNTGTSEPFGVVVTDTTAPDVSTPANMVVGNDAATVTYDDATATDLVDGAMAASCTPASGTRFALGTTTVTCSATDTAGNTGTNTFTVEVQDVTKPIVTVPADITAEATDADGALVDYDVSAEDDVDGGLAATCSKASGTTFPLGTTTITCTATDTAGNIGDNSFTVTVEDTTAPRVSVPADITREATSPAGATVAFGASAADAVDGSVPTTCDPSSGATFALGTTTVICKATDAAGNTGSDSFTVTVEDTTAPDVTVPADVVVEATGPDGANVDYGDVSAIDLVDGPMSPTCSQASDTVFALGTTTVNCTAVDAANNEGTGSFTVEVVDTTAPEVHAPANLVVGNTSGTGADNVVYSGATADDLVSGSVPVTCSPASGSTFALGVTTVTCSATDAAGNKGAATFTIEVQDQTKPIVTVPADLTAEATGPDGAAVTWIGVTATDDVDGPLTDPTCTSESGAVFPLGTTTVTCSAADTAGNVGDNAFTVTVRDTLAPSLTVAASRSATATSAQGAVVTFGAPTATDIVDGSVAATCDKASGSVFPLGSTTVTCTATDAAGNTGTQTFTVTVTASWSGVLQPVNADGSSSFKLGSTVPVKFALTGASAGISNLSARLYLQRLGAGTTGGVLEAVSTSNATTGNLFRHDGAGQYIFNLATKSLSAGTYQLRIDLGDGVLRTVTITLR